MYLFRDPLLPYVLLDEGGIGTLGVPLTPMHGLFMTQVNNPFQKIPLLGINDSLVKLFSPLFFPKLKKNRKNRLEL